MADRFSTSIPVGAILRETGVIGASSRTTRFKGLADSRLLEDYSLIIESGEVAMPPAPNADGSFGVVIDLEDEFDADSVSVIVTASEEFVITGFTDVGEIMFLPDSDAASAGFQYYERSGFVPAKGYPIFIPKTDPLPDTPKTRIQLGGPIVNALKPAGPVIEEILLTSYVWQLGVDPSSTNVREYYAFEEFGVPSVYYAVIIGEVPPP